MQDAETLRLAQAQRNPMVGTHISDNGTKGLRANLGQNEAEPPTWGKNQELSEAKASQVREFPSLSSATASVFYGVPASLCAFAAFSLSLSLC